MKNMYKLRIAIVFTSVLLIFSVSELSAKDSYWSNFYTKKKKRNVNRSYLSISPVFATTFAKLEEYVFMGAGGTIEWRKTSGLLMYGFEFSSIHFWGKNLNDEDGEDDKDSEDSENNEVVKMYLMFPLYFKIGMNFEITDEFHILPFLRLGGCFNLLEFAEDGISVLGASEYVIKYGVTMISSGGVDFFYKISDLISVDLGISFNANTDIVSKFKTGMFATTKLGVVFNF